MSSSALSLTVASTEGYACVRSTCDRCVWITYTLLRSSLHAVDSVDSFSQVPDLYSCGKLETITSAVFTVIGSCNRGFWIFCGSEAARGLDLRWLKLVVACMGWGIEDLRLRIDLYIPTWAIRCVCDEVMEFRLPRMCRCLLVRSLLVCCLFCFSMA